MLNITESEFLKVGKHSRKMHLSRNAILVEDSIDENTSLHMTTDFYSSTQVGAVLKNF